jgi:hypothetical protein
LTRQPTDSRGNAGRASALGPPPFQPAWPGSASEPSAAETAPPQQPVSWRRRLQALSSTLKALEIGTPITTGPLTLFPLLRTDAPLAAYALLDEALDAGLAEVTEISDGGSVPELLFRNRSDRDILLVDGEELVGAKQNRVLNLTILVGAFQDVKIPVSCVEAGRWAWRSRRFSSGKKKLHARARFEKMRGVPAAMRESGTRSRGDIQGAVWRSVDEKMASFDHRSPTSSLHEVFDSVEDRLQEHRGKVEPQPGQVGAAFTEGGEIAGVELFDAADTLGKMLPKLVDSYLFDALELESGGAKARAPSLAKVRALLKRIADAEPEVYAAVAKGEDLRIDRRRLHAAALADGERLVHLSAFEEAAPSEQPR